MDIAPHRTPINTGQRTVDNHSPTRAHSNKPERNKDASADSTDGDNPAERSSALLDPDRLFATKHTACIGAEHLAVEDAASGADGGSAAPATTRAIPEQVTSEQSGHQRPKQCSNTGGVHSSKPEHSTNALVTPGNFERRTSTTADNPGASAMAEHGDYAFTSTASGLQQRASGRRAPFTIPSDFHQLLSEYSMSTPPITQA